MSIVLANGRKAAELDLYRATLNTYFYGLYVNNVTLTGTGVLGDLTECSDSGYTGTGRQSPVFTSAVLNGSDQGQMTAPTLTWTFSFGSGGFTVYGYFVATLSSGGVLVFSERAAAPFAVTAAGQTYSVTPKYLHDTL